MIRRWVLVLTLLGTLAHAASIEQLVAQHFRIRIRLGEPAVRRVIEPTGPCVLLNRNGEVVLRIDAGEALEITCPESAPAPPVWRIVLREHAGENKPAAQALAARVGSALNFPTEVIEVESDGNVDALRVVLGQFRSRPEAEAYLQGVARLVPDAYLWRDDRSREIGRLTVRDGSGRVLGRFWEECTLVPIDSGTLMATEVWDERRVYPGHLIIRSMGRNWTLLINSVHVDDYLPAVVAAEIGDAPQAALRAQAIAARSEALAKVGSSHFRSPLYDIDDTARTQVYRGVDAETGESRQAVSDTRGQVLVYDGEVCDAVYSHSAGGVTAAMQDVWHSDGHPYLTRRLDTFESEAAPDLSSEGAVWAFLRDPPEVMCDPSRDDRFPAYARDNFRWRVRYRPENLAALLDQDVGVVRHVEVLDRAPSGRVRQLRIVGSEGQVTHIFSPQILRAIPDLRSTLFVVDEVLDDSGEVEEFHFIGGGWGHGVGMCQMGALMRGLAGQSHGEILQAYYPLADIRRLY